ncbi:HAMP domain-containing histidine kinase [Draconibacterium sp.]|nr:HAMP domain-containing histidine kinase [Draconibacterium sp.]
MFKKSRLGKKRILLYYFLAIVLPSIILGALAFRGVINDQAISEKESRQLLSEKGTILIEAIDLFLSNTEEQFTFKTYQTKKPPSGGVFFYDSVLTELQLRNPVIESIIYVSDSGGIQLLNSGLLYYPDGTFSQQYPTLETKLSKGWQYEFQEKNNLKALNYYQNQIKLTKDKSSVAAVYLSLARVQQKLLKYEDALHTYKLVEENYGTIRMDGGLPLGVAAFIETGRLYLTTGDTLNALKSTFQLLTLTSDSDWELEIAHYNQLISACNEILKTCETSTDDLCREQEEKILSLLKELKVRADNTNQQLATLGKAANFLKERGTSPPLSECEYRVYTNVERTATFFSVFPREKNGQWIIVYNLREILRQFTEKSIPAQKESFDFEWQIVKEGRELLGQSAEKLNSEIKSTLPLPSYLPSWSLVLFKEPAGIITTFLSASQGIFIYIFLFIVVLLALGLFFTLQIINNEFALSKMKSDFISTVSHEFKSPLTSIRQMTEMLYNERIKTESRKKEYYAVMLEQSERLSHLIDNILDFSKIEDGKKAFRFEKTDIEELINHLKSIFQKSIANEGFNIVLSVPERLPEIVVDREAIQQVLYNLLDNAYKYSGNSKEIKIVAELTGNELKISVQDYGVGIDKEDQSKIFDRFYRGGTELTRSIKGSGIGLTIVKKIIDTHHGKVSFESTPGKGSTFIIHLPLKQED